MGGDFYVYTCGLKGHKQKKKKIVFNRGIPAQHFWCPVHRYFFIKNHLKNCEKIQKLSKPIINNVLILTHRYDLVIYYKLIIFLLGS